MGFDVLTGSGGADVFAVNIDSIETVPDEFDIITDFEDGLDVLAIVGLTEVDSLTWSDGANGVDVFVNDIRILELTGISSSVIDPSDFGSTV